MTTGTIDQYEPDHRRGYIMSDSDKDNERIPFEVEKGGPSFEKGDRVSFDVRGGLAGIVAVNVKKL